MPETLLTLLYFERKYNLPQRHDDHHGHDENTKEMDEG